MFIAVPLVYFKAPDTGGIRALLPAAFPLGLARERGDVRQLPPP